MKLYLMQHGEAVPAEEDADRPLSAMGRADVENIADYLGRSGAQPRKVWHSGKTRAAQTAAIVCERLGLDTPGIHEDLRPDGGLDVWLEFLEVHDQDVLLVGHLPHMARLASVLVSGEPEPSIVNFEPGAVACLERWDDGQWMVTWVMQPGVVRT